MRRSTIIATLLLFASPLFAQGKWQAFVATIDSVPPNGAAFLNVQYGFISTSKGVYRTTDGGVSWKRSNLVASINRAQFYFYTPQNIFFNGELESTDSGMSWQRLAEPAQGQLYIKNGIFFDASGRISYTHARSWKIIDTNYLSGETIAGNLDSSVVIWGGSAFGNDSTLYTHDLGRTWHYGHAGIESDFGYAIPFTQTFFRAGGDGGDAIERSNDGGANWDTTFGPINLLSDGIGGDGCVVYAQTMDTMGIYPSGLLRSTDQGSSWLPIGGPIMKDDYPVSGVASRGAVCFAMSYRPGEPLYKYIDSSLLRPILSDVKINRSFPDTIFLSDCDSIKIKLNVGFTPCDFIRMQSIRIDSIPSKNFRLNYKSGNVIREGHPDSASISFSSLAAGTYNAKIHIALSASDWSPADTSLPVVLVITPNPPVLIIDKPDTMNFGTSMFCTAGASQDIHLSNLSCHPLKVIRTILDLDSNSKYDFSSSMPSTYLLKEGIGSGRITVKFAPISAGIKTGKLIIVTSIGNDTIALYGNVLPPPKTLATESDTLQAPLCGTGSGFLHFYNKSCRYMTIDSLNLPSPFQLLPFRFPAFIPAGDSIAIPVRFSPTARGLVSISAKANLTFYMPYEQEAFDTILTLSGYATRGPSAYSLSENTITFDTLRLCSGLRSKRITLYSTGCDSLTITNIAISGDPDFSLAAPPYSQLAPGDSFVFDITLNPISKGNKSAFITITKDDNSISTIPITAPIIRALRILSSPINAIAFASQHTCENTDTLITITNSSCDSIRISGVGFLGSGFGSDTKFPLILPPFGSKQIHIFTYLDTSLGNKSNRSSMTYWSDADNILAPIEFSRSYLDPQSVHLWLDAANKPLTADQVWFVKLKGIPGELANIHKIDFSIDYNSDLLEFLPDLSSASSDDGKNFTISGDSLLAIDLDSSVALLELAVYLSKETSSAITLHDVVLNSDDSSFMGCMALPLAVSNGPSFSYQNVCGDPHVRALMLDEPVRFSINPNPAKDAITINLNAPASQNAAIEIFDALGKKVNDVHFTQ